MKRKAAEMWRETGSFNDAVQRQSYDNFPAWISSTDLQFAARLMLYKKCEQQTSYNKITITNTILNSKF